MIPLLLTLLLPIIPNTIYTGAPKRWRRRGSRWRRWRARRTRSWGSWRRWRVRKPILLHLQLNNNPAYTTTPPPRGAMSGGVIAGIVIGIIVGILIILLLRWYINTRWFNKRHEAIASKEALIILDISAPLQPPGYHGSGSNRRSNCGVMKMVGLGIFYY